MNPPVPIDPSPRADFLPPGRTRRLRLLVILVLAPLVLVPLPALFVDHFFGRRPTFARSSPAPAREPDVSALRGQLERSAQNQLPAPGPLDPAALELTAPAARLDARAEKIHHQAESLGGSATDGLPANREKHVFVEVPAGRGEEFRALALGKGGGYPPASPGTSPAATAGAKDHVEVIIRAEEE